MWEVPFGCRQAVTFLVKASTGMVNLKPLETLLKKADLHENRAFNPFDGADAA